MKKKIVLGMGMLLLLGSLTACGKTGNGKVSNEASNTASKVEESKEEGKEEKKKDNKEDSVYTALMEKYAETIYYEYIENNFNYSIKMLPYEHGARGYGYLSYDRTPDGMLSPGEGGELFVTQYSGDVGGDTHLELCDISKYEDSTDIFELLVPVLGYEGVGLGEITDYEYEVLETKVINGFEMTKFKGEFTADFGTVFDVTAIYPFVAYGVKGSKTPVLICYYDRTDDQGSIDGWMEKIDYVAYTYKELDEE